MPAAAISRPRPASGRSIRISPRRRAQSDASGYYKFVTIKPALSLGNHHNAGGRSHPFLVFAILRRAAGDADVFPAIRCSNSSDLQFGAGRKADANGLLVRSGNTQPEWRLYRFNIVLRHDATPTETS